LFDDTVSPFVDSVCGTGEGLSGGGMLVADIAEARWRGLMRQLTEARGETSTALAERAGLDRPRWSYVTVGDRLPADVTERRALLTRVLDTLEAPPSVRLELELLAGTTAILPAVIP
jgi:hypothetical protein